MDEKTLGTIITALSAVGLNSPDDMDKWINEALSDLRFRLDPATLTEKMTNTQMPVDQLNFEISRRNLARWFEIPEKEFIDTPVKYLEPGVLIRHIVLETLFEKWLREWTYYDVTVGEDFDCGNNIVFVPDIYARRVILHGSFEIFVCFVCDNPPNTYRVRALFEQLECFAKAHSGFGERDIFLIVTPFTFGRGIIKSISLVNLEENYLIVGLEGNDLSILQWRKNPDERLFELIEIIDKVETKRKLQKTLHKLHSDSLRNGAENEALNISRDKARYFENSKPFGQKVFYNFPSAHVDITEASKCFALARNTACVMHLQRVIELGLESFASFLGVQREKPSWGMLLSPIRKEIEERNKHANEKTDKTKIWKSDEEKEFGNGVRPFLEAVRIAWRNPSMHKGKNYTEDEAEDILHTTKGFMRYLSAHLDEYGNFSPTKSIP